MDPRRRTPAVDTDTGIDHIDGAFATDFTDEELAAVDDAIIQWLIGWIEERCPGFFLPEDDSED